MSSGNKTTATELAVACGVLSRSISRATLLSIQNVKDEDIDDVLAFQQASVENCSLLNTLWNVGNTIGNKVGRSSILSIFWTGKEKRSSVSIAAQDLKIMLNSGAGATTEVSVKVGSKVIHNRSIEWLRVLLRGEDTDVYLRSENWYSFCAPIEQNEFFQTVDGPAETGCRTVQDWYDSNQGTTKKKQFASHCAGLMRNSRVKEAYARFVAVVSRKSAEVLNRDLDERHTHGARRPIGLALRKLIRLDNHAYVICGLDDGKPFAALVPSYEEFSKNYNVIRLEALERARGQPEVGIKVTIQNKKTGSLAELNFHTEIRWSHGKFCGNPEGKIYRDFSYTELPWLTHWPIKEVIRSKCRN